MNDLSCGISMWAQVSFVLSQIMRLTDRRTDGQRSHCYTVRCITCSRAVKTSSDLNIKWPSLFHVED